eukprot:CAMPEP_0169336148 /NCGR_PEP_ID=MMETSP1017-20121227/16718_1 /TAXON_ID=342587 /ORGANISM="Karlodinium micrum, Strain CCMP2283" /LENGTH=97 /DNA_ID=CAMNT_0009431577 /DNA_START=56 /DNA_END=349 /DNA_ORIENTATION=-
MAKATLEVQAQRKGSRKSNYCQDLADKENADPIGTTKEHVYTGSINTSSENCAKRGHLDEIQSDLSCVGSSTRNESVDSTTFGNGNVTSYPLFVKNT